MKLVLVYPCKTKKINIFKKNAVYLHRNRKVNKNKHVVDKHIQKIILIQQNVMPNKKKSVRREMKNILLVSTDKKINENEVIKMISSMFSQQQYFQDQSRRVLIYMHCREEFHA